MKITLDIPDGIIAGFALTTLCVKDEDKSYEGQSVGETLRMLPLELADREIDKSWWFFNTFVITLK